MASTEQNSNVPPEESSENGSNSGAGEAAFNQYYSEVKQIEIADSCLTPQQQIDRLLRPGSTYLNLNPFEVLKVSPDVEVPDIKKMYRKLSILVHPDKNQDNVERAQQAFEIVNKAWKTLENEELYKRCLAVIEEAKEMTKHMVEEKRKKLKKEGKPPSVDEDDSSKMDHSIYVQTMKLFADMERKRREQDMKEMHERKRKREEEIAAAEKQKMDAEWQKNFDESRDGRVNSWRDFKTGSKAKKQRTFLKPPKTKQEHR
ncbi:PREDICTED: dnaJ homolog subfamily C member 8-like [Priapulus caudatus]|uniref:DnaJ homolog subfamily C member 8-like n=1 Tax=Priapulus caudatus TaxID=37621 RepID=A0ABM1F0R5_PRICU|nr:PREDICTED: dnaJ homolog subfamily C member 8-like [Priapulus caudatus]